MVLLIVMADNHSLVFEVRGHGFIDSDADNHSLVFEVRGHGFIDSNADNHSLVFLFVTLALSFI
jgi:hypothetical protein